jgi:hypothetical protein
MKEIENELMLVYEWIDSIPLNKQKKSKRFFRQLIINRNN